MKSCGCFLSGVFENHAWFSRPRRAQLRSRHCTIFCCPPPPSSYPPRLVSYQPPSRCKLLELTEKQLLYMNTSCSQSRTRGSGIFPLASSLSTFCTFVIIVQFSLVVNHLDVSKAFIKQLKAKESESVHPSIFPTCLWVPGRGMLSMQRSFLKALMPVSMSRLSTQTTLYTHDMTHTPHRPSLQFIRMTNSSSSFMFCQGGCCFAPPPPQHPPAGSLKNIYSSLSNIAAQMYSVGCEWVSAWTECFTGFCLL